jgi:hypothetical protein
MTLAMIVLQGLWYVSQLVHAVQTRFIIPYHSFLVTVYLAKHCSLHHFLLLYHPIRHRALRAHFLVSLRSQGSLPHNYDCTSPHARSPCLLAIEAVCCHRWWAQALTITSPGQVPMPEVVHKDGDVYYISPSLMHKCWKKIYKISLTPTLSPGAAHVAVQCVGNTVFSSQSGT